MLSSGLDNILTWFRHPISNGSSEGFNSRIEAIKASARGFWNFANYRTRILLFCGKLSLKPPLNQPRRSRKSPVIFIRCKCYIF